MAFFESSSGGIDFSSFFTPTYLILGVVGLGLWIFVFHEESFKRLFRRIFLRKPCVVCEKKSYYGRTHEDKYYCDECLRNNFKVCDYCNEIVDSLKKFKGKNLCKTCFEEKIFPCSLCKERFLKGDLNTFDSKLYCDSCHKKVYREFKVLTLPFCKLDSKSFINNKYKNHCGVEIECLNDKRDVRCFILPELKELKFSQITDNSLSWGGVEFNSLPANGDELLKNINGFCKELQRKRYYVDKSCGLHVHIGIDKWDLELLQKLYLFYYKYEKFFFNMLPESRQDIDFCKKFDSIYDFPLEDIKKAENISQFKKTIYGCNYLGNETSHKYNEKRYCWVNFHSIFYRGTLEIRNHSGTINPKKINNWLLIHLTIVNQLEKLTVKEVENFPATEEFFLSLFNVKLKEYIKDRWKKFPTTEEDNYMKIKIKEEKEEPVYNQLIRLRELAA